MCGSMMTSFQKPGFLYVVLQDAWNGAGHDAPPTLMVQQFKLTTNFFDVPPFYALHIWLWKENPAGMFASYNPNVACPAAAAAPGAAPAPTSPRRMPGTGGDADHPWLTWCVLIAGVLVAGGWLVRRNLRRAS
jgi:hypothetical protein